jgi:hypothetical protein
MMRLPWSGYIMQTDRPHGKRLWTATCRARFDATTTCTLAMPRTGISADTWDHTVLTPLAGCARDATTLPGARAKLLCRRY